MAIHQNFIILLFMAITVFIFSVITSSFYATSPTLSKCTNEYYRSMHAATYEPSSMPYFFPRCKGTELERVADQVRKLNASLSDYNPSIFSATRNSSYQIWVKHGTINHGSFVASLNTELEGVDESNVSISQRITVLKKFGDLICKLKADHFKIPIDEISCTDKTEFLGSLIWKGKDMLLDIVPIIKIYNPVENKQRVMAEVGIHAT